MNEKQATEVIKAALDLATSKGVFGTLNDMNTIITAYNVISSKMIKDESQSDNGQSN
jgi:hypothetical protein